MIIAAGCGSTTLILNSSKAPGETMNPGEYKKVMIVAYVKDEKGRETVLKALPPSVSLPEYMAEFYLG